MRTPKPIYGQPVGCVLVFVRLRGAGAAAPVVELGPNGEPATASATSGASGVTVVRNGTGDLTLTFKDPPGSLEGVGFMFHGEDTPTATTRKEMEWDSNSAATVSGTRDISTNILTFTPSTDLAAAAAADMAATEVMGLLAVFRTSTVNPL